MQKNLTNININIIFVIQLRYKQFKNLKKEQNEFRRLFKQKKVFKLR